MTRLSAILLLLTHLFNFCGYQIVFSSLAQKSTIAIEKRVDKMGYTEDELISIKTPLHLPYYGGSPLFERAYGSITIGGNEYEYVKRRVYRDTLEVLCLPNHLKTGVKQASADVAKSSGAESDTPPAKKGGSAFKTNLPQAFHPIGLELVHPDACLLRGTFTLFCTPKGLGDYSALPELPPRTDRTAA